MRTRAVNASVVIIRHELWIIIPAERFRFRGWIFQRDATADFIRRVLHVPVVQHAIIRDKYVARGISITA